MASIISYRGRTSVDDHEGNADYHKRIASHYRSKGDETTAKKHDAVVAKNLKRAERVSKRTAKEAKAAAKAAKEREKVAQMTGNQQAADHAAKEAASHGAIAAHHEARAEKLAAGTTRFDPGGVDEYARDEAGRFTFK